MPRGPAVIGCCPVASVCGYLPVLDHGLVSLVDYMGSDEDVEPAARVSYGTRKRSATRRKAGGSIAPR